MKYDGGKNAPGVVQRIISQIPRHRVLVELFGGSAAITRNILPAERNIVVEKDRSTVARFRDGIRAANPAVEIYDVCALRWLSMPRPIDQDWCIYCDPPYHPETLKSPQKYACKFTAEDHAKLLALLLDLPCPVLISGYRHPLYDVTLQSWRRIGYWVYDRAGRRRSESLWMNFPEPRWLHDARFVGTDRRKRESRKRRRRTFCGKVRRADRHELQVMAHDLDESRRDHAVTDLVATSKTAAHHQSPKPSAAGGTKRTSQSLARLVY